MRTCEVGFIFLCFCNMVLSTNPPRGTKDWFPEEYRIRKYIFDTWRKVCVQFGYEEYL